MQGEDKSPKIAKNPYNSNTNISVPRYTIDYIDSDSVNVDKFNLNVLNNMLTGMNIRERGKKGKRTDACLNKDASEDVVINFK